MLNSYNGDAATFELLAGALLLFCFFSLFFFSAARVLPRARGLPISRAHRPFVPGASRLCQSSWRLPACRLAARRGAGARRRHG